MRYEPLIGLPILATVLHWTTSLLSSGTLFDTSTTSDQFISCSHCQRERSTIFVSSFSPVQKRLLPYVNRLTVRTKSSPATSTILDTSPFAPFDMTTYKDLKLPTQDGLHLHGRRYQSPELVDTDTKPDHRILCWHGWMDNCASYDRLAPRLLQDLPGTVDLVTMEFPGHGQSSHKSLDGPTMLLMDYVYYVYDVMHTLKWEEESVTLVGHSMGAAVSLMYASAFPLQKLVLLDSLGPWINPGGPAKSLRNHCKARLKGKAPNSVYESLEQAIEARMLTAKTFPGNQWISKETATGLVEAASEILESGELRFYHDQRLKAPSILYLTNEQVEEIFRAVAEAPVSTCLLLAKDGMPFGSEKVTEVRQSLQPQHFDTLPGSHHFHSDPESADGVANAIVDFLKQHPSTTANGAH